MTTSKNTQSALRATLKQEDASLIQRHPDVMQTQTPVSDPQETPEAPAQQIEAGATRVEATMKKGVTARETVKKIAGTPEVVKANKRATVTSAKPRARKSSPTVSAAEITAPVIKTGVKAAVRADQVAPVSAPDAAKDPRKTIKVKVAPTKKPKPEKRVRDSFALAASEGKRLKTLRDEVKAVGRRPTKSEVVRASISALSVRSGAEIMALIEALPAIAKGRSGKKKR